ncbi:MAG: hypothetical protein C4320_07185 [Armatimonadota bacterium]
MLRRWLFLGVGIVSVGLGFIGLALPVMPGFVFFVIALACFRRSSPRFEEWILTRSPVASHLRAWETERVMRPETKRLALIVLWVAMLSSIAFLIHRRWDEWSIFRSSGRFHPLLGVPPLLLIIAIGVTWIILRQKTPRTREL